MPAGLLRKMKGEVSVSATSHDTQASAARARAVLWRWNAVWGSSLWTGELDKLGYDIESRVLGTGKLRFIEVKGRVQCASTVTVTKNEVLTSLNKPEDYILAIVEFQDGGTEQVHYVRNPFHREPDFGVTSVNYDLPELLARAEVPS